MEAEKIVLHLLVAMFALFEKVEQAFQEMPVVTEVERELG